MIRATKFIEGFGVLSERSAEDVLSLAEFAKKNADKPASNLIVCATTISQSLRYNYDCIKWHGFIKKWEMRKLLKPNYLLKIFSQSQIFDLYAEALLLEGVDVKKKVAEIANELVESPQTP